MATETVSEEAGGGFGTVSRIRGVLFEYLTLAASLLGVVALAILLSYVSYDAFGLETADPAWYGVFAMTVVVPTAAVLAYARPRPAMRDAIGGILSLILGGSLVTLAAIILLSVIITPAIWFSHLVVVVVPALAAVGYARYVDDHATWAGTAAGVWLALGSVVVSLDDLLGALGRQLVSPLRLVTSIEPTVRAAGETLGTPGIYFLTVLVPVAIGLDRYVARRASARLGHTVAGLVVGGLFLGVPVIDGIAAISRGSWVLLVAGFLGPLTAHVVLSGKQRERLLGLAFPLVVIGGVLAGRAVVTAVSIAAPSPWLDWQVLTSAPSATAAEAGLYPGIIGSIFIIVLVAVFTVIFGVGAAIYLEEYATSQGLVGTLTRFIQVNISNLAGVPSIVYGLLGLGLFIKLVGMGVGTVLVASLTLSLLILPIVIISAQEAIRSVPDDMRQAAYGMGATRWQTIKTVVLPQSLPGILTGTILALGRAIGETAPLLMIGIPTFITWAPDGIFGQTTAMPMLIFNWAFYPTSDFRFGVVPAAVVTLLVVLLSMNSIAIYMRNKYQRSA
jgi:phosphate transport system permease protein